MSSTETTTVVDPPPAPDSKERRPRFPWLLTAALAVGLLVRLTIRDRWPIFSTIDYALPPPLLAVLGFLAALRTRKSRPKWAAVFVGIAVLCVAWTGWQSVLHRAEAVPPNALKVCFWNTCRGWFGWENIAGEIRRWDADLVGLVEAGEDSADRQAFWAEQLPGYETRALGHGMVILTRGHILQSNVGWLDGLGVCMYVEVELRGKTATVVIVDIESNPTFSRKAPIESLHTQLLTRPPGPVIVMGDFNTPTDSVWFGEMHKDFHHAFTSRGNGYAPTWPVPLPVLEIDHVWHNDGVTLHRCRHGWIRLSDHRPIFCDVTFGETKDP